MTATNNQKRGGNVGKLTKLFTGFRKKETGATRVVTSAQLAELLAGVESSSGVHVSVSSAVKIATVWACVRLLAESIAQLPCHVYVKNRDGSKSRVTDTALADLLGHKPNGWQTPFEYTEFMITALAMRGNHYAKKVVNGKGEILELIPFQPGAVTLKRNGLTGLKYEVMIDGRKETFDHNEISHVRGLTFDGFHGVSPLTHHRETLGLAEAANTYGGRFFKNSARPSGSLEFPNELSEEAYQRIRKSWNDTHGGDNAGGTAIFEQGGKFSPISMSNEDAQYLEVRQFQRTEICSIYRIPPHMVGDLTKSSFSNITQQSLEFVKYTILPWCVRAEQAMMRDLLSPAEHKRGMFVEHVVAGLERADIQTRYAAYKDGVNGGWLSPNEVRLKENMNPRKGGDIYLMPMNMVDSTEGAMQPDQPQKMQVKSYQLKGVERREMVRLRFMPRFLTLARSLVGQEVQEIRELLQIKAVLPADLKQELAKLYGAYPEKIKSLFHSVLRDYGVSVKNVAVTETTQDGEIDLGLLAAFIEELLEGLANRHIYSSLGQLEALINGTPEQELAEAIETRLVEWEERRAQKIAENEVVQQENAIAAWVWAGVGVTHLQWVNRGSETCPFCKSLNGKIVGIHAPFIEAGNYEPEGHEGSPWKVRGPKLHAPIHRGCTCTIIPVGA